MRVKSLWNVKPRIFTKEEMIELLECYKTILNTSMIDYLNDLIELRISVIKDVISSDTRKSLAEVEIYKRVVTYNIYNMVSKFTKEYEDKFKLTFDMDSIGFYMALGNVDVFSYYPRNDNHDYDIMNLYQIVHSEEKVQEEIQRIMNKLEKLRGQHNPFDYPKDDHYGYPVVGGPGDFWSGHHQREISIYEDLLKKLVSKKSLTENEEKQIEITSKLHKDLIDVFDLDLSNFKEQDGGSFYSGTRLEKKLVKCMPWLNIIDNTKYI